MSIKKQRLEIQTDLLLLLRCKVILDVERLANLLGLLAFDHVRNSLAGHVEEASDVEVVGGLEIGKPIKFNN